MEREHSTRVLSPWNCVFNEMRRLGAAYGDVYEAGWFEQRLSCLRNSKEFAMAISEVRRELESDGFCLSEPCHDGNQFVILPPESNSDQMLRYQRHAIETLGRGINLGTNTRIDLLSESQRRRHEAILERIAKRAALVGRRQRVL